LSGGTREGKKARSFRFFCRSERRGGGKGEGKGPKARTQNSFCAVVDVAPKGEFVFDDGRLDRDDELLFCHTKS